MEKINRIGRALHNLLLSIIVINHLPKFNAEIEGLLECS
jgi:hypothetical protein